MAALLRRAKYKVICEPVEGEIECGDQWLIKELTDFILIVVADGLGHGAEAANAAKKAIQIIDANVNEPIENLFKLCNEGMQETRGAAITIVKIDRSYKLAYIAIGNVMGVCWNIDRNDNLKAQSFFLEGGIVGVRLMSPSHTVKEILISPGVTIIIATDGIKTQFENEPPKYETPEKIAQKIFDTYRNKKDDGLVLVLQLL